MGLAIFILLGTSIFSAQAGAKKTTLCGGWTKCENIADVQVQKAANAAVSLRNSIEGDTLSLLAVQSARQQVVAGMNYSLSLKLRNAAGRTSRATAVVWSKFDGSYELTSWSK